MSLLNRLGRDRHVSDRQFPELWMNGGVHPHFAGCADCRKRYDAFATSLVAVAEDMRAEAERELSPERLAVQRAQILRRLEALERPARVIMFPRAARAVIGGHSHVRRWVTVAAAAGLIAGIGLGQLVDMGRTIDRQVRTPVTQARSNADSAARAGAVRPASASPDDDKFLVDTEEAAVRQRVPELRALDDLTPRSLDSERPR